VLLCSETAGWRAPLKCIIRTVKKRILTVKIALFSKIQACVITCYKRKMEEICE
jgi:hypothetical protein